MGEHGKTVREHSSRVYHIHTVKQMVDTCEVRGRRGDEGALAYACWENFIKVYSSSARGTE